MPPPTPSIATAQPAEPIRPELLRELRRVVGEDGVLDDADRLLVYESDGLTQYRMRPSAVVLPRNAEEVAAVFRILDEAGIPVVPRGAGTGLSGGALAVGGGVIVGTARMNRILEVDAENRTARVEPGVVNALLTRATLPHGLIYAPDPSSQSACTLGGNVAENSGGPHCLKYGVTSRYITALAIVLPSGETVRLGGPDTEGELDLVGLFVGSEGCFGIAVEIEAALVPVPEGVRTLLGIFDTMEDAGRAVTEIMARGLIPAALEIIDRETIRAVEASVFAAGFPTDAGAALVVELDGDEAGLDAEVDITTAALRGCAAREVRIASDDEERAALWRGRKKAFGAMGRIAPDLLVQDATVPRSRLPDVLARIAEIGTRHRLRVANVFHAGDGNLHPNLLFDRRDADELARVEAASTEIMKVCIDAGGTITGEHGVGIDKRGYLPLVCPPPVLRVMGEVRRVFDPAGRSNPGKVLPDGWGPPWPPRVPMPADRERNHAPDRARTVDGTRSNGVESDISEVIVSESGGSDADGSSGSPSSGILEHLPADLVLRAGGGTLLSEISRVAGAAGQWFPFDPPGGDDLTLGEALASGRSGPLQAGFGRIRDHVLGVTFEARSGEVLELGGRVVKNVAGFDLVRLVVGSGDRLGRFLDATIRLFPLPEVDRTLLWEIENDAEGFAFGRRLAGEWIPAAALCWFRGVGSGGGGAPSGGSATDVLALRLLGSRAGVAAIERRIESIAPADAHVPAGFRVIDGDDSGAWWRARAREAGDTSRPGFRVAGRASDGLRFLGVLGELAAGAGRWAALDLVNGGLDLRLPEAWHPIGKARAVPEEAVRSVGGRITWEVDPAPPAADDPARARLLRGIEAVFAETDVGAETPGAGAVGDAMAKAAPAPNRTEAR